MQFDQYWSRTGANQDEGHLVLTHTEGEILNWLFAPAGTNVNADQYKHVLLSMEGIDMGSLPGGGITALFVWIKSGELRTQTFQIYPGEQLYKIDLSSHSYWTGTVELSRFHFPQGDQTVNGYTPAFAKYEVDWIAITNNAEYTPVQDTTAACQPEMLAMENSGDPVINGTSISLKGNMLTGNTGNACLDYWEEGGDTLRWDYGNVANGTIYASLSFLDTLTVYNYRWSIMNAVDTASVQGAFTTGEALDLDLAGSRQLWFTPTPLSTDPNELFTGTGPDQWTEARSLIQGYHVRDDHIVPTGHNFDLIEVPAMIYELNRAGLTLSMEADGLIPVEINDGAEAVGTVSAQALFTVLDVIYDAGGRLHYLSPDGTIKRVTAIKRDASQDKLTYNEAIQALGVYHKTIHEKYPDIQIGYLVNFPNWNFQYSGRYHYGTNAGTFTDKIGKTFDQVIDDAIAELAGLGEELKFIETDNPYRPYYVKVSDSRLPGITLDNASMLRDLWSFCQDRGLAFGMIFNSQEGGKAGNKNFYDETLAFQTRFREDVGMPDFLNVESWYTYPDANLPETTSYTFMNLLKDFAIRLDQPLGQKILQNKPQGLTVYPNPSRDGRFTVEIPHHFSRDGNIFVSLYNVNGKLVHKLQYDLPDSERSLSLGTYQKGFYLLRISNAHYSQTVKIILD